MKKALPTKKQISCKKHDWSPIKSLPADDACRRCKVRRSVWRDYEKSKETPEKAIIESPLPIKVNGRVGPMLSIQMDADDKGCLIRVDDVDQPSFWLEVFITADMIQQIANGTCTHFSTRPTNGELLLAIRERFGKEASSIFLQVLEPHERKELTHLLEQQVEDLPDMDDDKVTSLARRQFLFKKAIHCSFDPFDFNRWTNLARTLEAIPDDFPDGEDGEEIKYTPLQRKDLYQRAKNFGFTIGDFSSWRELEKSLDEEDGEEN